MVAVKGYVRGNTVVVENEDLSAYNGYEVEVRVLDEKQDAYAQACAKLRALRGSGIWEGNLDEMREAKCPEWS